MCFLLFLKKKILYCTVVIPLLKFERCFKDKTRQAFSYNPSQCCASDFGIPLVTLVGKLLRVRIVFADADEVDLQLKLSVGFVSKG